MYRVCLTHPSRNSVFNFKSSEGFPGIITLPVAPRPARRSAELIPSCSARARSGVVDHKLDASKEVRNDERPASLPSKTPGA